MESISLKKPKIKVDIENYEFFEYMQSVYEKMRDYENALEAKQTAVYLEQILNQDNQLRTKDPELYSKYKSLVLKFRFVALPVLDAEEGSGLVVNNLLFALSLDSYDLKWFFDGLLVKIADDYLAFKLHDKVWGLIRKSSEKLGSQALDTNQGQKDPTIENWIAEYLKEFQGRGERGAFEEVSFVTKNRNAQKLSENDRALLKKLLDFYDWLEFPKEEETQIDDPELEKALKYVAEHADEIVQSVIDSEINAGVRQLEQSEPSTNQVEESKTERPALDRVAETTTERVAPKAPATSKSSIPSSLKQRPVASKIADDQVRSSLSELQKMRKEFEPEVPAKKPTIPTPPRPILKRPEPIASSLRPEPPKPPSKPLKPPKSLFASQHTEAPKPKPDREALYRSTLDELQKMREEYEGEGERADVERQRGAYRTTRDMVNGSAAPPKNIRRDSISVNEAIIREGRNGRGNSGEIVAGGKEIDEKLEELKKKLRETDRN